MANYDDGVWPDELTDLAQGMKAIAEAEPDYVTAGNYYTGDVPEFFASNRIARLVRKTGTSFRVNVARKAVTAVTDRLEITAVTVPDDEKATQLLQDAVWDANELTLEAPLVHEKACEYGDAYLFVWEGEEPGTVEIEYSGAIGTRAIYDPEHPRKISYVIKTWEIGVGDRKRIRVNLYYEDRIEKWVTAEGTSGTSPEQWVEYRDDPEAEWPLPNPYGMPVFHFRTSRPYGLPLHREAYGAQDAINKLVVTMMNASDFHFVPQRAALVDASEEDDDDFDEFGEDLDEDFDGNPPDALVPDKDRARREPMSKLRTGPGSLWLLRNVKELVQLPAAEPSVFLDPAEFFLRLMAQAVDMPLHFFDPGGDQPSGDSRRQSEGTLTKKVDRIEDSFEATWKKALVFALKILGTAVPDVNVQWAPTATTDDAEGWQTAITKINAGVPVRQVLLEAGYDAAEVDEWLSNSDEQDLARRVAILVQLASVARDLGAAATLGIMPADAIASLLSDVMGKRVKVEEPNPTPPQLAPFTGTGAGQLPPGGTGPTLTDPTAPAPTGAPIP